MNLLFNFYFKRTVLRQDFVAKFNLTYHNGPPVTDILKTNYETPQETLPYRFNKTLNDRVQHNKAISKWVIKVIILCGKQCNPLREHREDINKTQINSGNFIAILRLLSETNSELKKHLDAPAARNAKHIFPQIQNELIDIVAFDVLQKDLIEEINQAKYFSILADEVENHHVEQLPLCMRFVNKGNNIREEFIEFGKCKQVNGEAIANEIVCFIEKPTLMSRTAMDKAIMVQVACHLKLPECKHE